MSVNVDRDRAHGPIFDLVVEPARDEQFIELAPPLGSLEPAVIDLLDAVLAGKLVGAFP